MDPVLPTSPEAADAAPPPELTPQDEIRQLRARIAEMEGERRHARESESHYRTLFEQTGDGILLLELGSGPPLILDANEAALRMHGYSRQEMVGQPISLLEPDITPELVEQRVRLMDASQPLYLRHRRKDGSMFDIESVPRRVLAEGREIVLTVERDITERKRTERQQRLRAEVLQVLIGSSDPAETISRVLSALQRETGADALGLRLREGDDFPYFSQAGFSPDFLLAENTLTVRGEKGVACRDQAGNVSLECTCGLVLSGKTDPRSPLFTAGGSCWTNDAPALLHLPAEQDPRLHPRNRCIHAGFHSVALVPIRAAGEILGLLQLNYRRKNALALEEVHGFEELCSVIGLALRRRQAEEKLRGERECLAGILRGTRSGIWEWNVQTGDTVFNERWAEIIGYTLEEIAPVSIQTWIKFCHPDDLQASGELLERHFRGELDYYECEARVKHKDGSWVWVVDRGRVVTWTADGKPLLMMGTHQDITERKRAEEGYQTLFREMLDGFALHQVIYDHTGKPADYRFLAVNPAFERLTGLKAQAITGKTALEVLPGLEPWWIETYGRVAMTGEPAFFEHYTKELDQHFQVTAFRLAPDQFACIFADITERKRAEESLRESEEHYRELFENSQIGMYRTTPDGRIVFVNPCLLTMLGYTSMEELTQRNLEQDGFEPGYDRGWFKDLLERHGVIRAHEAQWTRCDGRILHVLESARAVRDSKGTVLYYEGEVQDITERRRAEEEKEQLRLQLQQVQKLESIGRLAGGVAHDFNNLLTVINGYSDLLLARLRAGDPLRDSLTQIRKAGGRAAELTAQLLAFGRKQAIQLRPVSVSLLVLDSVEMLQRLLGEDIDLVTQLDPSPCEVMADEGQLHQVLMNLAANARAAMPAGGRLVIRTSRRELDEGGAAEVPGAAPGACVVLEVSDNGTGMSEEVRQNIFEPFFTTKEVGQGTGLGLAMVYGIVRQAEGWITVQSQPGVGSTFRVVLPLLPEAASGVRPDTPKPATVEGSETILVAEDQDQVRKLAVAILKAHGYRTLEARSGDEALQVAGRHPGPIHLLLTDVVMPRMSGAELASRLKAERGELKVLYMSGHTGDRISHRDPLEPGTDYLQKPFSPEALAQQVRALLERRPQT